MTRVTSPTVIGRAAELTGLDDALRQASAGESRLVVVGGEAGVGKTRLVEEFAARAATAGTRVLTGGCLELGTDGLPYAPMTAALRQLLRDVGPEVIGTAVPDARVLARLLPELGAPNVDADPAVARTRLFEHVLLLFQRLGAERPLAVIVEDAHWADASTRDLLVFLARSLLTERVLLVITFRSDELHRRHPLRPLLAGLDRLRTSERLELEPLSRSETAEMIKRIGRCEATPSLVRSVFDRSAGNPLFVESLLCCNDDVTVSLDDSLRDLLLRSVDALAEPTRRILRIAAAGGVEVGHRLLVAVAGDSDGEVTDAARPAVEANVLVVEDDGYRFRHALIREAVHDELLPGEHTSLHTAFARAIEADPSLVSSGRAPIDIAHHWYAAHDARKALAASAKAAQATELTSAYAERLHMLDRVLSLWSSVPDAVELAGMDHVTVLEEAAWAASDSGEPARGIRYATAALDEIDRDTDPVRAAKLLHRRLRMRITAGEKDTTQDLDEVRRLVTDQPHGHDRSMMLLELAKHDAMTHGIAEEPDALAAEALADARAAGDRSSEARILTMLAILANHSGNRDEGLRLAERARAIAESVDDPGLLLHVLINESDELEANGDYEQAAALANRGIALARDTGFSRSHGSFLAINVANPLVGLGRWDEALTIVGEALELDPPPKNAAFVRTIRAGVAMARGDLKGARADLAVAAPLMHRDPEPQCRIPIGQAEAEFGLGSGQPGQALAQVLRTLEDPAAASPRYTWPLLAVGGRAVADLTTAGADEAATIDRLTSAASALAVPGPVERAAAATVRAELARAAGDGTAPDRWRETISAWEHITSPYPAAYARYRLGEALLGTDRDEVAGLLASATETADALHATPLGNAIHSLAKRARITLVSGAPVRAQPAAGLTERELDVIRLLAAGRSNRQIADELFISPKTASVHVSNILTKLEVANRGEAAAAAYRLGLVADARTG